VTSRLTLPSFDLPAWAFHRPLPRDYERIRSPCLGTCMIRRSGRSCITAAWYLLRVAVSLRSPPVGRLTILLYSRCCLLRADSHIAGCRSLDSDRVCEFRCRNSYRRRRRERCRREGRPGNKDCPLRRAFPSFLLSHDGMNGEEGMNAEYQTTKKTWLIMNQIAVSRAIPARVMS
jgi:hypothetical protein